MILHQSHGSLRRARHSDDRGSQFIEFGAYFPLLLLTVVIAMELFLSFFALERMESAARAGARVAAEHGAAAGRQTAIESLPSWLNNPTVQVGTSDNAYFAHVSARMPILNPGSGLDYPLSRRVEMPSL